MLWLSLFMFELDFGSDRLDSKLQAIRSKAIRLSSLRLLAFFVMGAFLILGLSDHPLWLIPGIAMVWLFISLIQKFNHAKDQESIYLAIGEMETRKKARQNRDLVHLVDGSEFSEKSHPFSGDLDLFGTHSLFQLVNHTTSSGGKKKLAQLLGSDFSADLAQSRAEAVSELMQKTDFLRSMEAVGLAFQEQNGKGSAWKSWLAQTEEITFLHRILAWIGPTVGFSLLVLITLGLIPQAILGIWVVMGVLALSLVFKPLKLAAEVIPSSAEMKSMAIRTRRIEEEEFASEILSKEKSRLYSTGKPASAQIQELDRLGLWVQNRFNLLYLPLNLLLWTDFFLFVSLAKWKRAVANSLHSLPESLENWEVWVSLGSFEVEVGYPGKRKWTEEEVVLAENAIHPLLHPKNAIGNSLSFSQDQKMVLLTGANMSGKTTFMRTLGINAVLVNLGLRPFADLFVMGPIQLYTSMRNSDNLGESVSSFYAELNRIKKLIQVLESGNPVFFLLDEILKGTNTQDRISGSKALIHQILQTPGFGIISTHDIELSELGQSEEGVLNFSFHSEIRDETIHFDYKLKKGPCPSFNAHKLMELMGIRFEQK